MLLRAAVSASTSGATRTSADGAAASALFGLLRDGLLSLYDHAPLLEELANVRLRETKMPGVVRVDHDPGRHDDMVQALGFAVTALLERPGGTLTFEIPTGHIRSAPIDRRSYSPPAAPGQGPVEVVHEGQQMSDRLLSFKAARRHAGYQRPGSWR